MSPQPSVGLDRSATRDRGPQPAQALTRFRHWRQPAALRRENQHPNQPWRNPRCGGGWLERGCFRCSCLNASHRLSLSSRPLIQHCVGHGRGHGGLIEGSIDAFDLGALRERIHPKTMHPLQLETAPGAEDHRPVVPDRADAAGRSGGDPDAGTGTESRDQASLRLSRGRISRNNAAVNSVRTSRQVVPVTGP